MITLTGDTVAAVALTTLVVAGCVLGVVWLAWMTRVSALGKGIARAATTRA